MAMKGQRVSNWVPTGRHTLCPVPACGSGEVWVAYFVHKDKDPGWQFFCRACGAYGEADPKSE